MSRPTPRSSLRKIKAHLRELSEELGEIADDLIADADMAVFHLENHLDHQITITEAIREDE